jgi:glutathione peroxidase
MRKVTGAALAAFILGTLQITVWGKNMETNTVYQFKEHTIDGKPISLEQYKGKVLLIVNVASHCGYTPQYAGLEKLYEKYKEKGFVILGFPCNQFGAQEPGTAEEIKTFCSTSYNVTFPLFTKIEVNGDNADPLYKFLKAAQPGTGEKPDIRWNFTKFLIGKDGKPIDRFDSKVTPEQIDPQIEEALKSTAKN